LFCERIADSGIPQDRRLSSVQEILNAPIESNCSLRGIVF
jgi:hypothetical protein